MITMLVYNFKKSAAKLFISHATLFHHLNSPAETNDTFDVP